MVGTVALTGAVMVEQAAVVTFEPAFAAITAVPAVTSAIEAHGSIHELAAGGEIDQVVAMLERDPGELDRRDWQGMTPLAVAAWHGQLDLVATLLDHGAQPDLKNNNGLTPLFCAVDRGRPKLARLLIENGADVTTRGYEGRSLVHMAARAGDTWVLKQAIAHGGDVSASDRGGVKPMEFAVWGNYQGAIRELTSLGAARSELPNPHLKWLDKGYSKHLHIS